MLQKYKKKGFTLVELIVVITILTILSTIAFISFQGYTVVARDSTRLGDINLITLDIETFRAEYGRFPGVTDATPVTFSGSVLWDQGVYGEDTIQYSRKLIDPPLDPLFEDPYPYAKTQTTGEYQISTVLEQFGIFAQSPNIVPQTYADSPSEQFSTTLLRGDYNGKFITHTEEVTPTLKNVYILGAPSLFTSSVSLTELNQIHTNNLFVYPGTKVAPASYVNLEGYSEDPITLNQVITNNPNNLPEIIYQGTTDELSTGSGKLNLASNIISYYSDTPVSRTASFEEWSNIDLTDPQDTGSQNQALSVINTYLTIASPGGLSTESLGVTPTEVETSGGGSSSGGGGSGDIPILTLIGSGSISLTVGDTYTELGATASDTEDGDLTGSITVGGDTVDTSTAGTYTVTYNVSDADNNAAVEISRTVTLTQAPFSGPEIAKLLASDAEQQDYFGRPVSISGDIAIVGASDEDIGGSAAGAAYIFEKSGSSWVEVAKIQASDKQGFDRFGYAVSISGDTAIVGAYGEDTGGSNAGAAYIFEKSGGTWPQTETAKIQALDVEEGDAFGRYVSISGDVAIVGAHGEDTGGSTAGAAYIFEKSGGNWAEASKIQASDREAGVQFGRYVSISGDVAIVGAYLEDTGASNAGAAYIFEKSGGTWPQTETAKIQASDAQASDYFGRSVSISGDTAIVGADGEDTGGSIAGAAYIFEKSGGIWSETAKIQASDAEEHDFFGSSVSISGDTAIVGSSREDTGGSSAGAAYIFKKSGSSWTETAKIQASDREADDYFGISVSISGDSAIVGSYLEDTAADRAGAAYIFE